MKNSFVSALCCFTLASAALVGVTACDKQGNAVVTPTNVKLTPANVAKLQKGMTRAQVVALFGEPTTPGEIKDFMIFKKQVATYTEGKESLSVTYKNDEVEEFTSTVGSTKSTVTDDGQTKTTTTTSGTKSE